MSVKQACSCAPPCRFPPCPCGEDHGSCPGDLCRDCYQDAIMRSIEEHERGNPGRVAVNYIDKIACEIGDECGIRGVDRDENGMRLLRIYAVLALTVGARVTWEHVHDAWSAWRSDTEPDHRSIVWFSELPPDVQALDARYADAIERVARRMGRRGT